jgi:predicted metalloprotease with PDZ domain
MRLLSPCQVILLALLTCGQLLAEEDFAWAREHFAAATDDALTLAVDARTLPKDGLVHSRLRLPQGQEALRYPRWIPGIHAPGGPVENIGGLRFSDADGQAISWSRDPLDPWRFRLAEKPQHPVQVDLSYIANQASVNSYGVDIHSDAVQCALNWNALLVYPESVRPADLQVHLALRLPRGWASGSALVGSSQGDNAIVVFDAVSLETLIDSPLVAGASARSYRLNDSPRVDLHVVGGDAASTVLHQHWRAGLQRLPGEAHACFGGAHYPAYDFLLMSGDHDLGLEHRRSSLNGIQTPFLTEQPDNDALWDLQLLPHEYVHSWIGKYRRPVGMWTEDYHSPKNLEGLWIYEGLTQYYGTVLAARCGLISQEQWRVQYADLIDEHDSQPGRHWRSLRDCCRSSFQLRAPSLSHGELRRGQDYYTEGALFWLRADLAIRQQSAGAYSLDDVCAAFFGPESEPGPFHEHELIDALKAVADKDWAAEIAHWIDGVGTELEPGLLDGSGWRLTEDAPVMDRGMLLAAYRPADLETSLGLWLDDGWVHRVRPDSPSAVAGLKEGDFIYQVGEVPLEDDPLTLAKALIDSPDTGVIRLYVFRDDVWRWFAVPYQDGLRLRRLQRQTGEPDLLGAILAPRVE